MIIINLVLTSASYFFLKLLCKENKDNFGKETSYLSKKDSNKTLLLIISCVSRHRIQSHLRACMTQRFFWESISKTNFLQTLKSSSWVLGVASQGFTCLIKFKKWS